ncbi:GNAT family N-acetyltransferase [Terrabacter sp. 2RAF25]|uniref:GNAT family N-acetyltransferase n=1 Tax=Terrabacter sp. 2RAF25 TaxID=3232998 RepID=UPI003F9603B0
MPQTQPDAYRSVVGEADAELDQRLSDELDVVNAAATVVGMTWVREDTRGHGLGERLLAEFEAEARARGCTHVFVTSFTFQAPGFYEKQGYREIFRWEGVPTPDASDVHLRKEL